MNWKILILIFIVALGLGWFSFNQPKTVTNSPAPSAESSGDVVEDLAELDQSMESLDVEEDFPTYTQTDLTQ